MRAVLTRQTRSGRRLSTFVAVLLIVASFGLCAPAAAATPTPEPTDPTPSTSPTAATRSAVITATIGAAGTTQPGTQLSSVIGIENPTEETLPDGSVTVWLGSTALADATAVDSWLDGTTAAALTPLRTETVAAIPASAAASVEVTVPESNSTLSALTAGSYPVQVRYEAGGSSVLVNTVITVVPVIGVRPIALVLPIIAPVADRTLLDAAELAQLTAPDGALTIRLDAVLSREIILAVDPAIPAAIRALGTSAPASARQWLARFDALPNDRFALPFADADIAVQAEAGLDALLQPGSLAAAMQARYLTPTETPTPSASATATPTPTPTPSASATDDTNADDGTSEVTLPTTAELTDIGTALPGVQWPRSDSVTDATRALLSDQTLLVSSAQLDGAASAAVTGSGSMLAYDGTVSAALAAAAETTEPSRMPTAVARVAALTALASSASAGLPILLVVDRGSTDATTEALTEAVTAVRTIAGAMSGWDAITGSAVINAAFSPADPATDATQAAALKQLLEQQDGVARFATAVTDPDLLTGRERARLLHLLAASAITETTWTTREQDFAARADSIINSVRIVPRDNLVIASRGVNIPVWINNDLDRPVTVRIVATPTDLRLGVQRTTEAVAEPQASTRVLIPVTSGISNGEVTLRLDLVSPTGVKLAPQQTTIVDVRADWEQIGLVLLATLVGLLLVFGTIRMVRRKRRAARAAAAALAGPDPAGPDPAEVEHTESEPAESDPAGPKHADPKHLADREHTEQGRADG